MADLLISNEHLVRVALFLVVLAAMAGWEIAAPCRLQNVPRRIRWPNNLGIVLLNTALVRLILPATAVGLAVLGQTAGWGLLNRTDQPPWLALLVSVVLLDLAIYLQHVLVHAVPTLWRLHRMHHADLEFDVTTGLRFHPLEILLSMALKFAAIAALGAPPLAVLVFEVLLNATALFNHGNVSLPRGLDRVLRWVMVTPDMHRVHHSVDPAETNSNFGFNLPWWDRLLGTYRDQPKVGHEAMTIGIGQFRSVEDLRLDRMLIQPLRGPASDSSLDRNRCPM